MRVIDFLSTYQSHLLSCLSHISCILYFMYFFSFSYHICYVLHTEPMEWAEENSFANQFSAMVSSNDIGYKFKQTVADLVAGEYDKEVRGESIKQFISETPVAMYSFTTCPFCRKAKDYLEEQSIPYTSIELDELPGNEGNEIRAELGRLTKRTSVPSIFIGGEYIGGCNDGPGLLPLAREDKLNDMLEKAGVPRN